MPLHADKRIRRAAQMCTHAHTEVQCTESSCLRLCHRCKRIPPAGALAHSINLPAFDRNYAHLFSHSPHAEPELSARLSEASGFSGRDGGRMWPAQPVLRLTWQKQLSECLKR